MEELEKYALGMNANKEVTDWLMSTGKKYYGLNKVATTELEHILDYLVSTAAPKRLQRMSIDQAKKNAEAWTKAGIKKGRGIIDLDSDIESVFDFENGDMIVRLKTKQSYKREGFFMSHCLGQFEPREGVDIYSLRDSKNMPHATFEVRTNSTSIEQIKGKGKGDIHPKYINSIMTFLEFLGFKPRPSEMVNLGFYHVHKTHLDFLKSRGLDKELVRIGEEYYA